MFLQNKHYLNPLTKKSRLWAFLLLSFFSIHLYAFPEIGHYAAGAGGGMKAGALSQTPTNPVESELKAAVLILTSGFHSKFLENDLF